MPLFCGIDVHKKSWRVNIRNTDFELENYSQDPRPEDLLKHLEKNYPGASYQIAYEAGFCGFGIERFFNGSGVSCIVVNPADVPSSDKDRKRKQDKIDARKISRQFVKMGFSLTFFVNNNS
jgi:transposase